MEVNERTSLLHANQNGNGAAKKMEKFVIRMPKDPIFVFEECFGGLSLHELLPYQDNLWWKRLRNIIFYSFWFMFLVTFASACFIAYYHRGSSCNIQTIKSTTSSAILTVPFVTSTTLLDEVLSSSKIVLAT